MYFCWGLLKRRFVLYVILWYDMERRDGGKYRVVGRRVLDTSTVFQNGKTHIPLGVRDILGVDDGGKIVWVLDNGKVHVESALKSI